MRRLLALFVAVAVAFTSTACAFHKVAQIQSDPAGARIRIRGVEQGVTPAAVKLGCSTFDPAPFELSKVNYRTVRSTLEYRWSARNMIVSVLFAWVPFVLLAGILVWGKCPDQIYNFTLEKAVSELDGKSTLTVTALDSPYEMRVAGHTVIPGQRLVLEPGWHPVHARLGTETQLAGEVKLEANVDHVVALSARPRPN